MSTSGLPANTNSVMLNWYNKFFGSGVNLELPNYKLLLIRPISLHEDDVHLAMVLCHLPENHLHPYATWICSVASGRPVYMRGSYFRTEEEALNNWLQR